MSNEEHLALLRNGVDAWNAWRRQHPDIEPNLQDADLRGAQLIAVDLRGAALHGADLGGAYLAMANFRHANLREAHLSGAKLWKARFHGADLRRADLRGADLSGADCATANLREADLRGTHLTTAEFHQADLFGADLTAADLREVGLRGSDLRMARIGGAELRGADLGGADLGGADLGGATLREAQLAETRLAMADLRNADLCGADLRRADLSEAKLWWTHFRGANLSGADLSRAELRETILADIDLSNVKGLHTCRHIGPSIIEFRTLQRSGQLPVNFLRGCGLPERLIEYLPSILSQAWEYYSCFISYTHADRAFARRLHDQLQGRGIRCWLDEKQLLPGDVVLDEIDRGIKLWDKVLLCCSEAALKGSPWVDREVDKALEKEERLWRERGEKVLALIPLNLDGYLFRWDSGKASVLRSRLAPDFTGWERDNARFEEQFERVVRALRTGEGGREPPPEPRLRSGAASAPPCSPIGSPVGRVAAADA